MSLSAVTTVDSIQTALDGAVCMPGTIADIQVKFTDKVFARGFILCGSIQFPMQFTHQATPRIL